MIRAAILPLARTTMRIITLIVTLALGIALLSSSTGCETVKGVGKDIHDASTSVQSAFVVD